MTAVKVLLNNLAAGPSEPGRSRPSSAPVADFCIDGGARRMIFK